MPNGLAVAQLQEHGAVVLRRAFAADTLTVLREAAVACFDAVKAGKPIAGFNPYSHSVILAAMLDFGCNPDDLLAPLSTPGLGQLFLEAIGGEWVCNREQSWIRSKLAPQEARPPRYHPQDWHQDGALGVKFPIAPGPAIAMTELVTCWIPLNPCGIDSPGLEFVRGRQPALLHFTELDDSALRRRFEPEQFWAPELEFGDGLVFLNSVLHRTYTRPEMTQNRLSVEYRIFPLR